MNPLFKTPERIPLMAIQSFTSNNTLKLDSRNYNQIASLVNLDDVNDVKRTLGVFENNVNNLTKRTDKLESNAADLESIQEDINNIKNNTILTLQQSLYSLEQRVAALEAAKK